MINIDFAFVIQAVNFAVLLLVLNIFLFRPIRKVMAERAGEIDGNRARAAGLDQEVQEKVALYEARLRDVKAKAGEEKGKVKKEALAEEAAIVEKARKEATEALATIKNRVAKEAADAKELLREQARALSREICEKVLGRSL